VAGRLGVRVLRHPINRGYGAALRTGLAAAREPWCVFLDGDGQVDPLELPRLVTAVGDADIVAGYRAARADPSSGGLRPGLAPLLLVPALVPLGGDGDGFGSPLEAGSRVPGSETGRTKSLGSLRRRLQRPQGTR
jgi:glycosyltransferase involved in cell wall biosynthesis